MAKINYDKVKAMIEDKVPDVDVDEQVKKLQEKLRNISKEGALLIVANKAGVKVKTESPNATIKTIDSLREGEDFVEIAGAVIQVYDLKFYEVCPSCGKRARELSGAHKCEEHGIVNPAYSYLWNIVLDDGTDSVRVTLFSKQIERLLGMDSGQVGKFRQKPETFEEIKSDLLGKLLAFRGKVKTNTHTGRKEFTSMFVFKEPKDVTPRTEAITTLIEQREKIPDSDHDDLDELENSVEVEEIHINKN